MNFFLQSRADIDHATKYMEDNGYITSGLSCKNWEFFHVAPYLKDGALLDMGSSGSIVLANAIKNKLVGDKVGVDLEYPENIESPEGIKLMKGDLMGTGLPNESFDYVTCLSVIEHEIDFSKFAKEVARLLKSGAHLFVSFDFWNPKPLYEKRKLYKLDWNILDEKDVLNLIDVLRENGLHLVGDIDWTTQDAVINDTYCSPVQGVSYTFGIFHFIKI